MEPHRYEEGSAMKLAGLRRTHKAAEAPQTVGAQWGDLMGKAPVPNQTGDAAYGAYAQVDMAAGTFEYMTGAEVTAFPDDPSYDRMELEPHTYAVFAHAGHISGIGQTWQAVFAWLAASADHEDAHAAPFERYGPGYDAQKGEGDVEIWMPVRRTG